MQREIKSKTTEGKGIKEIWIWFGKFWYNQVSVNEAKGYITFENIKVKT